MQGQNLFLPRNLLLTVSFFTANKTLKQDKSKTKQLAFLHCFYFNVFLLMRDTWFIFFPQGLYLTHCFYHTIYSKKLFTSCFRKYSFPQQWNPLKTSHIQINGRAKLECGDTGKKSSLSILLLMWKFTMAFRQFEMEQTHKGAAETISHFRLENLYFDIVLFHKSWRMSTFLSRYSTGLKLVSLILKLYNYIASSISDMLLTVLSFICDKTLAEVVFSNCHVWHVYSNWT